MAETTISGLADKAATDLGMSQESPTTTPATAAASSQGATPTTDTKTPPATSAAAPATEPSRKDTLLAELRGMVEKKEVNPEELAFVNQKLQSSFGKLHATSKAVAESLQQVLDDKGVILPDGKTVADVMNEPDGGRSFAALIKGVVGQEVKPLMDAKQVEDLRTEINNRLVEAVEANPDIEPLLPEVGRIIDGNPLLKEALSAPRYIPLVLTGVARDLMWAQEKGERIRLEGENERYKKIISDAEEASRVGSSTSRAATTPTPVNTAGASNNILQLADRLYDAAVADAKGSVN